MSDLRQWLHSHGLSGLGELFAENDIDFEILFDLSDEDIKELGLTLGLRKKLRKAIALGADSDPVNPNIQQATDGSPVSGASQDAERRHLTVMFADLVSSTALSGKLDPEELRTVLTRYQNEVAGAIARYEGMVAKYMGDGVLAYFGWPRAHEDDAERAVRTALALMQSMSGLRAPGGEPLLARVGIATGLVIVGDLIGEGAAQEEAVVGETPNLAARLQALAEPGEIVIAGATRKLIGDTFELRDAGRNSLKGIAGKTQAFVVQSERSVESRFEARLSGAVGEMVGRDHELGLILERWRQARDGDGQMVLLTGEAGIGKSRVTRALIESVEGQHHVRFNYQCSPYHTDSVLYPAIQQLLHVARITSADSNDDKLDKLEGVLRGSDKQLIANLLGLATEHRYGPLEPDPQQLRRQTLRALADELFAPARDQAVLFVLEDVHWIDATTMELIELCLDRLPGAKMLLLVTARPTFENRFSGHPSVTELALNRLSREQIAAIAGKLAGGKALPNEVLEEIARKTDGVPLFVEELTKTVLESGDLVETEGGFELRGPISNLAIPATLHDSLMARLDRLQPVKEVAQMAACIGREFEHHLLQEVSSLDGEALQKALQRLIEAQLIFRSGLSSDGLYIFKHALVRDAAYESLLKSRRKAIHTDLLTVLETRENAAPELLANHATQAGAVEKATGYWRLAGERAMLGSAVFEAIGHLKQARKMLLSQPLTERRDEAELEVLAMTGSVCIAAYGYGAQETIDAFDAALALARKFDRPDLLFPILYGQYVYRYIQGGGTRPAYDAARQILDEAELQEDPVPKMVGHRCVAMTLYCQGDFARSAPHYRQAIEFCRPEINHDLYFQYGTDSFASAQAFLANITLLQGYPDQARKLCEDSLAVVRQVNHIHTLEYGLFFGPIRRDFGLRNLSSFQRNVAELTNIATEHKLPMWKAYATTQQGWYLAQIGKFDTAISMLQDGLAGLRASGVSYDTPVACGQLAEAYLMAGSHSQGLEAIEWALKTVEETNERWFEPEIHRLKGELLARSANGAASAAKTAFETSLDLARALDAKWWELRTAKSMVENRSVLGEENSVDLLRSIYDWYNEGFDTKDLKEARILLEQVC